jgi:hypothetical protein
MNNLPKNIDDKKLISFLLGELSLNERKAVQTWIDASIENKNYVEKNRKIWIEIGKLKPQPIIVDTDNAWQKLSSRIEKQERFKTKI